MRKINLLLLCGGRSGEHAVSLASAKSVQSAIDCDRYEITRVIIGQDGVWRNDRGEVRLISPQPGINCLLRADGSRAEPVDVVFPVLHGTFGEDGCVQGLLELSAIPHVGSGVLGSSLGMNKAVQKQVLRDSGWPVVNYEYFSVEDWRFDSDRIVSNVERACGYPCFVKPVRMGSSVGISKARDRQTLIAGITEALKYDSKVIVELAVQQVREVECAVLLRFDGIKSSVLGEVVSSNEFYDHAAKYEDAGTELKIPAELDAPLETELKSAAMAVAKCLEAEGLARVDFMIDGKTGGWYVNEINTMPGFTDSSMYPKLWEATGMDYPALIDSLVDEALCRSQRDKALNRQYVRSAQ